MNHTKHGVNSALATLSAIAEYFDEHGWWPSVRDIVANTKWQSTGGVNYQLGVLEELGYLERQKGTARAMRITDEGYEQLL